MLFRRETLILSMVSIQTMSIPHDSVKAASKGENDMVMCLWGGNQSHADKTALSFNQSGNQGSKNHFPL